jgi:hypothetical protein
LLSRDKEGAIVIDGNGLPVTGMQREIAILTAQAETEFFRVAKDSAEDAITARFQRDWKSSNPDSVS